MIHSCLTLYGQNKFIIAGTGKQGYSGDSGLATKALLNHPETIAIDKKGNIYFAESLNNCVRKIDKKGIITTIAGTGIEGYNGDSIQATKAMLNNPIGVAVDNNGNVYIADTRNERIRKVDINGIIYTIAGTGNEEYERSFDYKKFQGNKLAKVCTIGAPFGVTIDKKGDVFIADASENCIRKIDKDGYLSNLGLNNMPMPSCIFFNNENIMYVVQNNDIRRMLADSFQIVAGIFRTYGYEGDDGLATNASSNLPMTAVMDNKENIYIPDGLNHCVRVINKKGIIYTIMGIKIDKLYNLNSAMKSIQKLGQPHGIAVDNKGYLYVADTYNNRIIKIKIKRYLRKLKS